MAQEDEMEEQGEGGLRAGSGGRDDKKTDRKNKISLNSQVYVI